MYNNYLSLMATQVGFISRQIHKYLASRIRNSGLEIWIRKKYLQIYNTASISLRFNLFLSYDLTPTDHKVRIYKEYHSVCPLEGIGTLPTPLSPASVPLSPEPKGWGAHSPAGEGLEKSQFRRLEVKLSTLPTLCYVPYLDMENGPLPQGAHSRTCPPPSWAGPGLLIDKCHSYLTLAEF
jgi:hypothetical protein